MVLRRRVEPAATFRKVGESMVFDDAKEIARSLSYRDAARGVCST
jgi:hypothetical protein